jgi:hypothetical protein
MTTIDSSTKICTLINVFTVEPEKHLELFQLLMQATETTMCEISGYISANLHISDDKKTITNYAQWASLADFLSMLKNEEAQVHMKKAASIAREIKSVTYNEVWTHSK